MLNRRYVNLAGALQKFGAGALLCSLIVFADTSASADEPQGDPPVQLAPNRSDSAPEIGLVIPSAIGTTASRMPVWRGLYPNTFSR